MIMLELMDLLRDWLSGDIQCQIEDVNANDDEYVLFNGTVRDAFYHFKETVVRNLGYLYPRGMTTTIYRYIYFL